MKLRYDQLCRDRYWAGFLLLCVLSVVPRYALANQSYTAEEISYLQQKKVLKYCVDPDWLPFEAIDATQHHIGMSAEYIRLLQLMLPVSLRLVPTKNWQHSLEAVRLRHCDFLSLAMATPSRQQFLLFSQPYLTIPSVIATTADKPVLDDFSQFANRPVGIRRGFGFVELYQQQYPGLQLIPYDSYAAGLQHVQSGLLYGFLGNMGSISYRLQQDKMSNMKIAGRLQGDTELSFASRSDEPLLQQILQKTLSRISDDDKQRINNQWLKVQFSQQIDDKLWWQLMITVLLLGVLGAVAYLKLRALNLALQQANQELERRSQHDPLTGLYNRQYFDHQLQQALALCQRQQLPMTLAMIDLDHFKQVNDECGHLFGDQCLKQFASLLQASFQRPQDILVRYGGEEFILISIGTPQATMQKLLQAFIGQIAATPVLWEQHSRCCTISIGAFCQVPAAGLTARQLLQLADTALYQAKHQGRDQLVLVSQQAMTALAAG